MPPICFLTIQASPWSGRYAVFILINRSTTKRTLLAQQGENNMAKRAISFNSVYIETKPEVDYGDKKRTTKRPLRSKSPHIDTKPEIVYTEAKKIKS
jgi:hypothetical protein